MKKYITQILVYFLFLSLIQAQLVIEGDTLVGNEWINYTQSYYKFKIHEDGIYRITYEEMVTAGIDPAINNISDLELIRLGRQEPIFISDPVAFGEGDFIEFYGKKNRGEIDQYLYETPEDALNPDYSLVTDTASYFLTWNPRSQKSRILPVDNDLSGTLPDVVPFYWHTEDYNFSDVHFKPTEQGTNYIKYSNIVTGEGFSARISNDFQLNIPASEIYRAGGESELSVRFGVNKVEHNILLQLNGKTHQNYELPAQYKIVADSYSIPTADVSGNNTFHLKGTLGTSDRVLVSQVALTYPRAFKMENKSFSRIVVPAGNGERLIELENFSRNVNPVIIDLVNNTRTIANVAGDKVRFKLGMSAADNNLIVFDPSIPENVKSVANIQPVEFIDFTTMDHDFLIISNKKLYSDPEASGENWVQSYADYRAGSEGGSYNPIVVEVDQLYDQFAYGINRHFISINNFAFHVHKNWPSLKYYFVIGKGIEYPDYRTKNQQESVLTAAYMVPAWGAPGSDNLLFARRGQNYALAPVGRIAATNPQEVKIYLDKVKEFEKNQNLPQEIEDKYWTKKIIHLSGGGNASEQNIISILLERMEDIVETEKFGADVVTFRKSSADPLQTSTSQAIVDQIDNGVSLITFFGHSAVGTFDFSLEEPGKYDNARRLPMILSLGCYSGNIFVPSKTKGLSEAFVLQPEVGALAFAAASGTAYLSAQGELGRRYYNYFSNESYGSSIGQSMHQVFASLSEFSSIGYVTLLQQMTFHGDPALSYIAHQGPDYVLDYSSIQTDPSIISTSDPRYEVSFDVVNIGSNLQDSMVVKIEHFLPDGMVIDTLYKKIAAPGSRTNTTVELNNNGIDNLGENRIRIVLDEDNRIKEYPTNSAESNNVIQSPEGADFYSYYVLDNAAKPIYPNNFGIVNSQDVILKASTSNLFTPVQNYLFQIDTSALFENPLEESLVNSGGGIIEFDPSITFENERVYYWRITPEEENEQLGRIWNSSSFVYSEGSPEGWNQSHYYQYLGNEFENVAFRNRKFIYDTLGYNVEIINKLWDPDVQPGFLLNYSDYAASIRPWNFMSEGVAFFIIDPSLTWDSWNNSGGDYGSLKGGGASQRVFGFNTKTTEDRKKVIDFIDRITPGAYVYFFTVQRGLNDKYYYEEWKSDEAIFNTSIISKLKEQGSELIDILEERGSVPYLFVFQKNEKKLDEEVAVNIFDEIRSTTVLPLPNWTGSISSKIGPSLEWNSFSVNMSAIESEDSLRIKVIGISQDDEETKLMDIPFQEIIDLNEISAVQHPYLKFEVSNVDLENTITLPQLTKWRVDYKIIPEIHFNQNKNLTFYSDTLFQGDNLKFSTSIDQIRDGIKDSISVSYTYTNQNNQEVKTIEKYKITDISKSIVISNEIPTENLEGTYQFKVEFNPDTKDKELYAFNNLGIKSFTVLKDRSNPILDVTFDGIRIMDGDIVSANPEIVISLEDDNPYFMINDPSLFELKLDTGNINNLLIIQPDDPAIEFIAATPEIPKATLTFRPNLKDGNYTFYVQGKDVSQNLSGENPYRISFRVVDKNSISNVFNYPNPFSTKTQFVFTLTGAVPDNLKIQIMTISGKTVKEIPKSELGDLRVGINRTEYWWDGTDDYGDKLANGVYLYRLVVPENLDYENYTLDKRGSAPESFFKKGYGKMVIMR